MSTEVLKSALPRLLFAGALAGLGLIATNAPAWAEVLKLQGYYTDFSLQLSVEPQTVAAGHLSGMSYTVASLGPDHAEDVVLNLREDADVRLLAEVLCARPAAQSVRCRVGALQPGQVRPTLYLPLQSNPDARGVRLLSGYVTAETSPTADGPGLNVDATWVRLVGEFDSGVRALNTVPVSLPDGFLRWTVELDNRGPSSLIDAYLAVSTNNEYRTNCRFYGNARCPQLDGYVYLAPGSRLQLDVEIPRSELGPSPIQFSVGALSVEGTQIGTRPRSVSVTYSPWIFRDGLEN